MLIQKDLSLLRNTIKTRSGCLFLKLGKNYLVLVEIKYETDMHSICSTNLIALRQYEKVPCHFPDTENLANFLYVIFSEKNQHGKLDINGSNVM